MPSPPLPPDGRTARATSTALLHLAVRHLAVRPVLVVTTALLVAGLLLAGCGAEPSADPADPVSGPSSSAPDGQAPRPPGGRLEALPPLHPAIDGLEETVVTLTSPTDTVEVRAKVATAAEDRARGLMEVTDLPDGAGMLFLFDQDRTGGFWMWNTLVPLDIAFADAEGVIHTTATMTPCEEERSAQCPVTAPDEPYRAALEVPAGWLERSGVRAGATMTWMPPAPAAG